MQTSERMLKWFFAYYRPNYLRHFTYYCVTQQILKENDLKIYDELMLKNFSVKKKMDESLNKLSPDQLTE